ncbi:MAG: hypothetical protein K2Q25_13690 [Mycobacteriaceae bacterium]|nr:hypothetical protein [Mycobacteriaceae bacterium]
MPGSTDGPIANFEDAGEDWNDYKPGSRADSEDSSPSWSSDGAKEFLISLETLKRIAVTAQVLVVAGGSAVPAAQGLLGERGLSLDLQIAADVMESTYLVNIITIQTLVFVFQELAKAALLYLYVALDFITCLELMNGFGHPDTGSDFRKGSIEFSYTITKIFAGAHPTEWSGLAAEKYSANIRSRQDEIDALSEADQIIAETLATQAHQVEQIRHGLAGIKQALVGSIMLVTTLMFFGGYYNPSYGFALNIGIINCRAVLEIAGRAALLATGAALILTAILVGEAENNRNRISEAKRKYQDIVKKIAAKIPTSTATPWTPALSKSPVANISNFANPTTHALHTADTREPSQTGSS